MYHILGMWCKIGIELNRIKYKNIEYEINRKMPKKMPKNNCLFHARWFEGERFKHWIRKKVTHFVATCNYSSKDVSVANMEEAALTSHMKCKKHVERSPSDQCVK